MLLWLEMSQTLESVLGWNHTLSLMLPGLCCVMHLMSEP